MEKKQTCKFYLQSSPICPRVHSYCLTKRLRSVYGTWFCFVFGWPRIRILSTADRLAWLFRVIRTYPNKTVGRDGSVRVATRYGLDGPGIESRWRRDFPHPSRPVLGSTMGIGSFPGVKRPGRGVDHPPSYDAEVKERVELYIDSTSRPSWPVIGWPLPLPLHLPKKIMGY
jgi:hypothetical protein